MKRAFTLIELLVVIAIIAILAAILFPVFAQAKAAAKKTVVLSNVKQLSTAFQIYMGDSDDVYPLAYSQRANGTWRFNTYIPFPAGTINSGGWDTPEINEQVRNAWAMSVQPYIKSFGVYELPGATQTSIDTSFSPTIQPQNFALTFNGLFHTLSASVVVNPSVAVVVWPGIGNTNVRGRSYANPYLRCENVPGPCVFNPGGSPNSAGLTDSLDGTLNGVTAWVFDRTMPIARADGSAKVVRIGTQVAPSAHQWPSVTSDPWAQVNSRGVPQAAWPCGPNGEGDWRPGANYTCYFRPDRPQ